MNILDKIINAAKNAVKESTGQYKNLKSDYVYQLTCKNNKRSACNVSVLSMITGLDVNKIDAELKKKKLDRQDQNVLMDYLRGKGFLLKQLTPWKKKYTPTENDFKKFKYELYNDRFILYHIPGHYLLLKGYHNDDFIFHDPAGDRNKKYFTSEFDGLNVRYTRENLQDWGIKWATYSVRK